MINQLIGKIFERAVMPSYYVQLTSFTNVGLAQQIQ